ncbi:MAG: hypothetical protein J5970_03910 [Bacilli bacterium]|nr:hypothetical protein [Bacilli bacterium]
MKKKVLFIILIILLVIGVIVMFGIKKPKNIETIKYLNFGYSTGTMMNSYVSYNLEFKDNKYKVSIKPNMVSDEDKKITVMTKKDIEKIIDILNKYEVYKWDGFKKSNPNVLDGDSFNLTIKYNDDKSISASGYMMWPKNYREVQGELDSIFMKYYENN